MHSRQEAGREYAQGAEMDGRARGPYRDEIQIDFSKMLSPNTTRIVAEV